MPLKQFEYRTLSLNILPAKIIQHYNLNNVDYKDGYAYITIQKVMYSVPQTEKAVNNQLKESLTIAVTIILIP